MRLSHQSLLKRIRGLTLFLIFSLFVSGLTAIPLRPELHLLVHFFAPPGSLNALSSWLLQVQDAIEQVSNRWPFLGLGTDWLAFGHVVIALGFLGLLKDPIRNEWLVTWGLLACGLVLPWAFCFGWLRGIPWGWWLVDCSFGVGGGAVLLLIRYYIGELKHGPK